MNFSKICNFECASLRSSESDSSSERDEEFFYPRTNASKHKTELCKTFEELGCCPYERKCRFAHGKHELVKAPVNSGSKARKCNGFWKNGCCSYGVRCQFGHAEVKWEDSAVLLGLEAACCERLPRASKLMKLLN